jgi:hypothetical protein
MKKSVNEKWINLGVPGFIFFIMVFISGPIFGQCSLSSALGAIQKSGKYDAINYYGVDVSHVWVNDKEKISRSENYSQVYPSGWIAFIEEELPPYGYVKKSLGFDNFNYYQKEILDVAVKVSPNFIKGSDNDLSADTLQSMIKRYHLSSMSGLGLVLVPETFSKPEEASYTWVVFFDIQTRKILFKCLTNGKCSHMGYKAHWGSGVVTGFHRFVKH